MAYRIYPENQFKKDLKKLTQNVPESQIKELKIVIGILASGVPLDRKYRPHPMKGHYRGWLECHVKNNLLLIYKFDDRAHVLVLGRAGLHSQLYNNH